MDSIWIDKIYIFFSERDNLLSHTISKVISNKYTHSGFIINGIVYDSQSNGVQAIPLDLYFNKYPDYKYLDVFEIENKFNKDVLIKYIKSKTFTTKYDILALFKHLLYRIFNIWIKSKDTEKRETCFELVTTALNKANKNLFKTNYFMSTSVNILNELQLKFITKYDNNNNNNN